MFVAGLFTAQNIYSGIDMFSPKEKHLKAALRKCEKVNDTCWTGHLTPVDILAILEQGCTDYYGRKYHDNPEYHMAKERVKRGKMVSYNFYFRPTRSVAEMLENIEAGRKKK